MADGNEQRCRRYVLLRYAISRSGRASTDTRQHTTFCHKRIATEQHFRGRAELPQVDGPALSSLNRVTAH